MKLSHSRVECFNKCPYQFKLKYIDKLETLPTDDPTSPLILGHALHTGIEKNVEAAIHEYYNAYPSINDNHITEALKLEYWIPKIKETIPPGGLHEIEIADGEDFVGYIDYLVPVDIDYDDNGDEVTIYDLYDWKYSNNVKNYLESGQLHEYKYFFEKLNPNKYIRYMYFMFVPKCNLKIKYKNKTNPKDETIYEFRQRVYEDLDNKQLEFVEVKYDPNKVIEFLNNGIHAMNCVEYIKQPSRLCDWCEYQRYCEKGEMINMALPKNERIEVGKTNYMKGWIYGAPFSGKTTFLDNAPDPLNLNTDGNTKYVTMQRLYIRDEVTQEGRMTKRKFAWDVFKEAIADLEKGSDFKTVIVDLVEDTREMCRLYMYDKLGIQHESDSGFGKGWDIIKTEYLSTMRRLLQLDYNIFLVSHEDISKDLTKKNGDKISRIAPNIQEAIANKLAGMVDFVARVIVEDDGSRTLSFKHNEVTFGGGRLGIKENDIPLNWNELVKIYDEAIGKATKTTQTTATVRKTKAKVKEVEVVEVPTMEPDGTANVPTETATAKEIAENAPFEISEEEVKTILETPEQPVRRTRKPREVVEEEATPKAPEEATTEETPVRRRRRRVEE